MKIRIEGCAAEELKEYSPYLSLNKIYEMNWASKTLARGFCDEGEPLSVGLNGHCPHLPQGARWVEVSE